MQVSVLFDYIPTPSVLSVATNPMNSPSEKSIDLKILATNDESTVVLVPTDRLTEKDSLKSSPEENPKGNEKLIKTDSETRNVNGNRRNGRSSSATRRAFPLYPNCMSDWDSTDSESGLNESNPTEENESCSIRS